MFATDFDFVYANICAEIGKTAEADSIIAVYETVLDTLDESAIEPYHSAKGNIALVRGDPELAIRHLLRSDELDPNDYLTRYRLAKAYLMADRTNDAIAVLEKALERYDRGRLFEPFASVRGYYVLGTAYQRAGRSAEAIEQYQIFLDIWQNADPELEEVPDAKARLEQLKSAG
jgi:tetratricopeptide (TPR) repeat protein